MVAPTSSGPLNPAMAVPPRVGTINIMPRGPAPSFFFCRRLAPAVRSCVRTGRCLQWGGSGYNRGPRFPLFMCSSRRYEESLARSSGGGTLAPWDTSGGTRGRNHRYNSPSPFQPDRVLPISTVRWAEQNGKPSSGGSPGPLGKELPGLEGIAVI